MRLVALQSLRADVRAEEGSLESYLPGPGQRRGAGLGHRVAQRDRGDDPAAVGDEPALGVEASSAMEDQHAARHVRQAAYGIAGANGCVIWVVDGAHHDAA